MAVDVNTIKRRADAARRPDDGRLPISDLAETSLLAMFVEPCQIFVAGLWPDCAVEVSLRSIRADGRAPTSLSGVASIAGVPFEVVVVLADQDPVTMSPRFASLSLRYIPRGAAENLSEPFDVDAGDWLALERAAELELAAGEPA